MNACTCTHMHVRRIAAYATANVHLLPTHQPVSLPSCPLACPPAPLCARRSTELLTNFKSHVCSCLGCCGDGTCYFPNLEQQWLSSLVDNVQQRVSKELELEGWKFEL